MTKFAKKSIAFYVRNVVKCDVYILLEGFRIDIVKYSKMHITVKMFSLDLVISSRVPRLLIFRHVYLDLMFHGSVTNKWVYTSST